MTNKLILFILLLGINFTAHAQLSDLHYLPPLKQGWNNDGIRDQAVYLSTPEPTNFDVDVYRGTSTIPFATYSISNNNPAVVPLADGDNNITLVTNANTGVVLNNSGLRFIAPSGNRFYVNYRGSSAAQSASLTSKGRKAMGTRFKWGGVPNLGGRHRSKSNTLGIMATEDNTTVMLSDYDPDLEFNVGGNYAGITADSHTITLNANESFVFENYIGNANPPSIAQQQGWIGASIVADKNIVISNGAMNYGRQINQPNRDAGIDQPVPVENIGNEYVFVRGNGMTQNGNRWNEFPLLIATADNTEIYINDNPNNNPGAVPDAVINDGEFYEVDGLRYSSQTGGANMYIYTTEDVYAYQCMAGHPSRVYTQGLNFVAPVNCLLPDTMNNIPNITDMAGTTLSGGLTIIAATTTPEANIVVRDGTGIVTKPAPLFLTGSADWKTYYVPNLTGNVSVQSTGPMAVGFLGTNSARGVAGYFSGFDTVPQVELLIAGTSGCFTGSTIYEATGTFDAYQWYRGDGDDTIEDQLLVGENQPSISPIIAGLYYVKGIKGPCEYQSRTIKALYCAPDIVLNKTVDKSEMMEGETATFTIEVENLGLGPLTNLDITDNIPAGLTYVSSNPSIGTFNGSVWNIGTLDGGDIASIEIVVRADEIDTLPLISVVNTVFSTQDQVEDPKTLDQPSAQITIHNDFDNDGIQDSVDLDDDNDGIYDTDECTNLDFNIANGNSYSSNLITVSNYAILDIYSIDNSFNLILNGTDIAGEIQFQLNAGGNYTKFLDGTGYGEGGNPNIWTISGSPGSPIIRVIVDQMGNFQLFGTRTSNGILELMTLTTPAAPFNWNATGSNNVVINQNVVGPTNMTGALLTAACDTDSDGYPDSLDLDKDNDGCTDANDFYKDDNADGGDDGEYGTGVPVVDPVDGTVNAASYIRVVAPIILLENTSEDLAGTDINGQPLSLGQTYNYVLRFQNTGDDDATNYAIKNILPENVNLINVDFNGILGAAYTEDVANHTLNISIPDSYVEIGDPEYTITITVELSFNCSDFVNACSSELENHAYSSYQGVINNRTFADENNTSSITGCPIPPQFPTNSISSDLSSCNQARTVELCTADVLLTAGSGFTGYTWFKDDVNGNPQPYSDGDPDSNPATLLVDDIGVFTVEKTSGSSCPDLTEIVRVERAGATQTNPIIEYFNNVNSDTNPNNDLQGEVVECGIDGTMYPKIFLCGSADEALIQLGITDAQSITWQKLDETSCSANDEDCPNRNSQCDWDDVATSNNFTATDSGEYRIQIVYDGGCNSTFYFSIFKNETNITATPSDIICDSPGIIRTTDLGSGFGYQLVNALTNTIEVRFEDGNGPNFNIATSGTYFVQATQLDPNTNLPIAGACIFETEDVGIAERVFSVNPSSTEQDCNTMGTITVQALGVEPNYSYELYVDDGSVLPIARELATTNDTHTFNNLVAGNYIVRTTTVNGCEEFTNVQVDAIDELKLGALTTANITCNPGTVALTPQDGLPSPQYQMAVWSVNGTDLYTDETSVPPGDFTTVSTFTFGHANTYGAGDYEFIVADGNGCFAISNEVTITDLGTINITASDTGINCADTATATLNISASGGLAPYQYSIDDGANYQPTSSFTNLAAGIYTITVRDASGTSSTACVESIEHEIIQPFRLTAAAAIIEDSSCNLAGEAVVKILNAHGGTAPYEYSFDGGSSFGASTTQNLLPGTYQLVVKDRNDCELPIEITVPNTPATPSFTPDVVYDCDGLGTITMTPSNTTDFEYTYALNSTLNTPDDSNIFTAVPNGSQTVTINYSSNLAPNQSTLIYEDFGQGSTTQIAEIGPSYCYEPQDLSTTACNLGPAGVLVTGEYAVTSVVTNPVASRRSPNDRSGLSDGRFLAIDIAATSPAKGILWQRDNIEVLPNREITIALWAFNRLKVGSLGNNPQLLFELVNGSGTVIGSFVSAQIPKSIDEDHWVPVEATFNPGANTNVSIILRSNLDSNNGNLIALDDILAYQETETCDDSADITVVVEDNQEFSASLDNVIEPTCFGGNNGEITFEVENFDAATGFQYSVDGTNWTTSTVSPVTTSLSLVAGTYTVQVQRINDTNCATSFTATLNQPDAFVLSLAQTADYTCFNSGGTLTATVSGGTPDYEYQLEDTSGNPVVAYQTEPEFINVADGTYLVRIRDRNYCISLSTTPVTISPPESIAFDLTPTDCYSGTNDGSVLVNVTDGNGNYEFRINNGTGWSSWTTPTPATATTYTFSGLSNGNYDVQVRDQLGCPVTPITESTTINPQLIASVDVDALSACSDGLITVNAVGGNNTLLYAIVPANTNPAGFYTASNTLTVTEAMATANPAGYDVYVQDNNGTPGLCIFTEEDIVLNPVPSLTVNAIPTDPECFDGLGSIDVTVSGGTAPYTYTLVDLTPADGIDYGRSNANIFSTTQTFNGIGVGDYQISITDEKTCSVISLTVSINNAIEIMADIVPILPPNCDDPSNTPADFGFEFDNVITPGGTVEYSDDWGQTWQASNELRGNISGTEVYPAIRVTLASGTICEKNYDRYIIPFPLDNLSIDFSAIIIGCNDLQVTVRGTQGNDIPGYQYTYTDDEANFNTFASNPAVWTAVTPAGVSHTFQNINPTTPPYPEVPLLIPGREYRFYVRDASGCIRFSERQVNDIPGINLPIEITTAVTPSCDSSANGSIVFNLNPTTSYPNMRWEIFELGNNTPIETSGGNVTYNNTITTTVPLSEGEYYIDVIQIEADNVTEACRGASENTYVPELPPLNATAVWQRDISCNLPGLISIDGISGGGGRPYTYDVSGPLGFTTLTGTTDNPVQIPVNSPAGGYTVTLYDQYSCPRVLNAVTMALAPNPTLTVTKDNCAAPLSLLATGASAAGNLRYAVVPTGNPAPTAYLDNGGLFNNIAPGSYDVYVQDGNGCINSQTAFEINPILSASATANKVLDCSTTPDAEISIEITSGSGNYEYEILDDTNTVVPGYAQQAVPSNSFTASISSSGNYLVKIYDTSSSPNCERELPVTISDLVTPEFTFTQVNATCFNDTNGSITLTQVSSGGALTYTMTPNPGSFDSATNTYSNLPAGVYNITAEGTNGCVSAAPVQVTITEPNEIAFAIPTVTEFGCASGQSENNATITINTSSIVEGSGTYTIFEFEEVSNPLAIQRGSASTYTFSDKAGGDVIVRVFDDKGCQAEHTVTVNPFNELQSASINVDYPINCNADENISIDVTGSLSTYASNSSDYEFRQLPNTTYQTSNLFPNLPIGTYTFGIRNTVTNCEIFINHEVRDPDTFDFNVNILSNVICYGGDGSIEIEFTDPSYTGTFSYVIYDTNDTPNDRTDDTPENSSNLVPLGTTAPIDLAAGNYLMEVVQDGLPSCSKLRLFTITTPSDLINANYVTENVGCSDGQGTALITVAGGQPKYEITLTNTSTNVTYNSPGQVNSHLFTGLFAGIYTVEITDDLGCTRTSTNFELEVPPSISGTLDVVQLECYGDTNGSATYLHNPRTATPALVPNYSYVLNKYSDNTETTLIAQTAPQNMATFTDLSPGFYKIVVNDVYNCSDEQSFEIIEPNETVVQLSKLTEFTCQTDATLELTASGGVAPYEWSIDGTTWNSMNQVNGADTHLFSNVTDGTYSYYVRDDFDCISVVSNPVVIKPIIPLTLAIDPTEAVINCYNESTGVIVAEADHGLGNYQYALFTDDTFSTVVRPYQSSGTFTDLSAGTYYVRVQSGVDCFVFEEVIIEQANEIFITPVPTHVLCYGDDVGSILIEATGGSGEFQYAIEPNLNQFVDYNSFENLTAGFYDIIVQDKNNGCPQFLTIEIEEPTEELNFELTSLPEICAGDAQGSITITNLVGGTPPYSTAIDSDDDADFVEGRTTFNDLVAGDYIIYVRDANGCPDEDIIRVLPGVNLNFTHEVITECAGTTISNRVAFTFEDETVESGVMYALDSDDINDAQTEIDFENILPGDHYITLFYQGCEPRADFSIADITPLSIGAQQLGLNEITATADGGQGEYTYYFNDVDNGNDNVFYITSTGTYTVRVVDELGCEIATTIDMEFIDIEIPNFFTPDGDGLNDTWGPTNVSQFPQIYIKIYDRYGREVYRITDPDIGWDGFYNQTELPTGDYWYIIKLNGEADDREFVGNFTLYR